MFYVIDCIVREHDLLLVILAVAIWLTGGCSLFMLLRRSRESSPRRARHWHALAAVTAGVAVWGTHFVAMLAYQANVPFSFSSGITALSVLVAILVFYVALRVHAAMTGWLAGICGGLIFAGGIAAMHFTGMSAIRAPALVVYDLPVILRGQIFATFAAAAAFIALERSVATRGILVASGFSLISVAAMHFTAMSATTLIPDSSVEVVAMAIERETLIVTTVFATLILAVLALSSAVLDRYLTDLRGLAEATLDGIVILRHGRIVEANQRFAALAGVPRDRLIDAPITAFLSHPPDGTLRAPGEQLLIRPQERPSPVEVTHSVLEYRGRDCDILSVRDLTAIKDSQRQIAHLAHHDPLTDLANRLAMTAFLDDALRTARARGERVTLLALDLDSFKSVNDVFGHQEGDRVLCEVARILRGSIRDADLASRIGGDEFIIVQTQDSGTAAALALAERIIATFQADLAGEKLLRHVGTSIGIAVFPDHASTGEALVHAADMALYHAKQSGRGSIRLYDARIEGTLRERRELEKDLGKAIANGELWLAYQPIFDSATRRITGYEALLRWSHPRLGLIGPDRFIPIAEETGLILPIGDWVLREACREAGSWSTDLRLSVNFSAMQFWSHSIIDSVATALRDSGVAPGRLAIEVTESVLLRGNAHVGSAIENLRALGVSIVMDDFGTGFSALSDLQDHIFDRIKIDRSFITDVEHDAAKQAIIRAIVSLGRALRLPVVAEGVETEAQLAMVAMAGCTEVQGFLLGAPGATPSLGASARVRA